MIHMMFFILVLCYMCTMLCLTLKFTRLYVKFHDNLVTDEGYFATCVNTIYIEDWNSRQLTIGYMMKPSDLRDLDAMKTPVCFIV